MNIRFAIVASFLVLFVIAPAIAQETQTSTVAKQNIPTTAQKAQGGLSSGAGGLPDEKSLLIGNGSTGSRSVKPVKSLGAWDYIQMVLVLALVIAGIYLLFYFLKRIGGPKYQDNSVIAVLSTKVLQPNRSLHLVDVGGRIFLVGTSENNVNLVASIEDKEAVDEIRLKAAESGPRPAHKSFRELFSGNILKGTSGTFGFGGSAMASMGFIKQQRERLKKM